MLKSDLIKYVFLLWTVIISSFMIVFFIIKNQYFPCDSLVCQAIIERSYGELLGEVVTSVTIYVLIGYGVWLLFKFIKKKIRIKNNMEIDHTNKFYNHKNHKYNKNFGQIEESYFSDGLEKVIELEYEEERIINTKIFLSDKSKDWKIYTRNYQEKIDHNIIHLKINPTENRTNARMISGGNFDFNDSSDSGYSLLVSMRFFEKPLLDQLSSILRDNKFGCFSSNYTIHAHRDSNYPSESEAKKTLNDITSMITEKLTKQNE